jgi:hypothetical protein
MTHYERIDKIKDLIYKAQEVIRLMEAEDPLGEDELQMEIMIADLQHVVDTMTECFDDRRP